MKITVNREYLCRHLFVVLLMLGLAGWFGYDGYVRYPRTDAAALYAAIEGEAPREGTPAGELERFKDQKVTFQRMFALAALFFGALIGVRLFLAMRCDLSFDGQGFTVRGKRYTYADVRTVDRSRWESKRIARVTLTDGRGFVLDAWHHVGVKDFYEKLKFPVDTEAKI